MQSCPPDTRFRLAPHALVLACALALAACGGSGGSDDDPAPVPPTPPTPAQPDPLAQYQWYLHNEGQDTLSGIRPVAGVDLNLGNLYQNGTRGQGVTVAVLDDGLDIHHEDLADNADLQGSINLSQCPDAPNLETCATDPTPTGSGSVAHGTSVGGIIGMVAENGKGGRGIAPQVRLKGFTLLSSPLADDLATNLFALGDSNTRANDVDIFNMSYGVTNPFMPDLSRRDTFLGYERVLAATRSGKGGIYVKSAGNEFIRSAGFPALACQDANTHDVGCYDTATDGESSLFGIILTAAATAKGSKSSYSSEGAAVWITGFGGEFNLDPSYRPTATATQQEPALLTTDRVSNADGTSCQTGAHSDKYLTDPRLGPYNAINTGSASSIDPSCFYTASFNGTSAASPTIAGVTALMLQTRPSLSARDVRYILATTARNDTWHADRLQQPARHATVPNRIPNEGRIIDPGWHENTAGIRFSRWFGYGLADAQAAVASATTFPGLPPASIVEYETDDDTTADIPYAADREAPEQTAHLSLDVPDDLMVEGVQIAFDTSHGTPKNLLVTLVSPGGTRIPVLLPYTNLDTTPEGFDTGLIGVNGFLNESSKGIWRLYMEDVSAPYDSGTGPAPTGDDGGTQAELLAFSLRILGHHSPSN